MSVERYPLQWPTGWKRTKVRHAAKFSKRRTEYGQSGSWTRTENLTVGDSVERLVGELSRLGVRSGDFVISSNLRVRLDGLPYSDQRSPDDPGVALYFRLKGQDRCLACDTWTRIADNIAAIAAHIEAIRAIERYGVGTMDQAFAGYTALPAKGSTWRTTLGFSPEVPVTRAEVERAFRDRAKTAHPDIQGGSHDAMASLTQARTEALAAIGV